MIDAVVPQLFTLAASMIVARLIGRHVFGQLAMIQSTIGVLGTFAAAGLGLTSTKYVAQLRLRDPDRTGRIIGMSMVAALLSGVMMSTLLVALAPWLAGPVLGAPQLVREFRVAALLVVFSAINGSQTGILAGLEQFRPIARINFIRGLASLLLMPAAALSFGLTGIVGAMVIGAMLVTVLGHWSLKPLCAAAGITITFARVFSEARILWQFSLPALLSNALVSPATWITNMILVRQTNGYWELGLYSLANQWRSAVALVPSVLIRPQLPLLANMEADDRAYWRFIRLNVVLSASISSGVALVAALFSPAILAAYGPAFRGGMPVLIVVLFAAAVSATAASVGNVMVASARMWLVFSLNAAWAACFIGLAALLVPRKGALGMAIALTGSYSLHLVVSSSVARKLFRRPSKPGPATMPKSRTQSIAAEEDASARVN